MSRQGLYVPKKAYFGPNLAVFEQKILLFTGGSKSFGTHITKNHLGTSFALFLGRARDQMGQKYLAKKSKQNIFVGGEGVKLLVTSYRVVFLTGPP